MTGVTAEKHDSFIKPDGHGGVLMEFSGKELIHGEPDASSFPSGGLRATFEARGYTAWDPTSYAFIRDGVLYIPTAFCSYGGEALDQKTPLLRSMEALSKQAVRVLKLFGHTDVRTVLPMVGAEQEYFLVERDMYERRADLIYTGRTLFGARPPKGQEMDDHYFGTVKPRVAAFMRDINDELWRLGVCAKTEHNEAAPAQHELACVYNTANIAADHNQLVMDVMQKAAKRHGLVCLLHEKPFAGVNGSGKHNNWSMQTDTGINVFDPGETPGEERAVPALPLRRYKRPRTTIRTCCASPSRARAMTTASAPRKRPRPSSACSSATSSPRYWPPSRAIRPSARRRRPSSRSASTPCRPSPRTRRTATAPRPFAYTGAKFEFRMPGSSASISSCNIALNTSVAEELRQFADELEEAEDFNAALHALIRRVVHEHSRIIFNGNGYDPGWVEEAARRGLHNLKSTPEALPHITDRANVELFTPPRRLLHKRAAREAGGLPGGVLQARHHRGQDRPHHGPPRDTPRRQRLYPQPRRERPGPAGHNARAQAQVRVLGRSATSPSSWTRPTPSAASSRDALVAAEGIKDLTDKSFHLHDRVLPVMGALRAACDDMETVTADDAWPIPTYGELLYGVK